MKITIDITKCEIQMIWKSVESLGQKTSSTPKEEAEMNRRFIRQLFDASDKVDALQSERDQLKKERDNLEDLAKHLNQARLNLMCKCDSNANKISELQSVIDQCEEAIYDVINETFGNIDVPIKLTKSLDAIQSLKLKGK